MNSKYLVLLYLVVPFLFMSCKNDEQMVQQVAYSYLYAMANYQVDNAEEYATEETRNTTLVKARSLVKAVGDAYIQSDTPAEIEITGIEMQSDTVAFVSYHKTTPIKDMTGTQELRKRNGQWYAHIPLKIIERPEPKPVYDNGGKKVNTVKSLKEE